MQFLVSGSIILLLTLTSFFFIYKQLKKKLVEIKQANKTLRETQSLYDVGRSTVFINHEIKNFSNIILGYIKYLKEDEQTTRSQKPYITNIERIANGLGHFCSEMNTYLQTSTLQDSCLINVTLFIEQCLQTYFFDKMEIFNIKSDKNLYLIYGNNKILQNLFINIIRNSLDAGSTEVGINITEQNNFINITIDDNGKGFHRSKKNSIFEYLFSDKKDGQGVGLTLARTIVEMHKGTIQALNKKDIQESNKQGVMVKISLPTYKNQAILKCMDSKNILKNEVIDNEEISELPANVEPDKNRPVILVVDDNDDTTSIIKTKLSHKYNVFTAKNGKDAINQLGSIPVPALIISNVIMAKMNGLEFIKAVKKNNRYSLVPFIFMSAKDSIQDRIDGLSRGAVDYITKPFDLDELSTKVDSVINHFMMTREFCARQIELKISRLLRTDTKEQKEYMKKEQFFTMYNITQREKEIIQLILKGFENKEIADNLNLSIGTIKGYISKIYKKCSINNRVELVRMLD